MNHKLIEFRNSKGLSPEEMALKLGISISYYYKIEQGSRNPSYNFLLKFKKEFNVNIDKFFLKVS